MPLKIVLGPMKSGKSFEMISHFAPLKYTKIPYALYQSSRNVRDENVWSRNGIELVAKKVESLREAVEGDFRVVGIDEIHMFGEHIVGEIEALLGRGTQVVATGLDTEYRGRMFPVIKRLLELGPETVVYKRAVCEKCKNPNAVYTQVLREGVPVTGGLPSVLPEDGTYEYKAVCRKCFVRAL
ncbi:MAG: thymidine kinase [Candidatus Aenigmatarchaeota archaeon]